MAAGRFWPQRSRSLDGSGGDAANPCVSCVGSKTERCSTSVVATALSCGRPADGDGNVGDWSRIDRQDVTAFRKKPAFKFSVEESKTWSATASGSTLSC